MSRTEAAQLALAAILTAIAGWVDAVGFLRLGGLYVSFMSGDTTQMAVGLARGRIWEGLTAAGLAALFVMGVFSGRLVADGAGARGRRAVLSLVAGLLSIAMVLDLTTRPTCEAAATAAMVLAMGAQNVVLARVGRAKASLTYVTGTLVNLGEALADTAVDVDRIRAAAPYLVMWSGLAAGAAGGAWSYGRVAAWALLVPAVAAALLALAPRGVLRSAVQPGRSQ